MDVRTAPPRQTAHPFVFFALYIPFGAVGGFLATVLGYELHRVGVTTAQLTILVLISSGMNVGKVLWAPLVDTTLTAKRWYLGSVTALAAGVILVGLIPLGPAALFELVPIVFVVSFAGTFVGMAADVLMAHLTRPERRGRAGGWSQAGNVGGSSLGAGVGLWLATHVSIIVAAGALAAIMLACALPLLFLPSESREHRRADYAESLRQVLREAWAVASSRNGLLAMLVLALPLGTGVASNYFAPIAGDWSARADIISLVAFVSAPVIGLSAVFGGYVCDWIDRKTAYVLFGLLSALVAAGMALAPRTPETYAIFVVAYAGSTGLAFAGYAALTLEAIGVGAAATKYNLLASVSNVPLFYVAAIEGPVQTRYGSTAMLLTEAALAVAGAAIYAVIAAAAPGRRAPGRRLTTASRTPHLRASRRRPSR